MKKTAILITSSIVAISLLAFKPTMSKLVSQKTHISFFSHTVAEDISANNYKSVSTLEPSTGDVVFSVPMQSFDFEKSMMQKHFNSSKFLDTKAFPKAKLVGKITNLSAINFEKDGTYNANIKGELTIKGTTKPVDEKGTITVVGKIISVKSKFTVTLADYGIAFEKGKPASNISKTVEITVNSEYQPE